MSEEKLNQNDKIFEHDEPLNIMPFDLAKEVGRSASTIAVYLHHYYENPGEISSIEKNEKEEIWVRLLIEDISLGTLYSRTTIKNALHKLVEKNYIQIKRIYSNHSYRNYYRFLGIPQLSYKTVIRELKEQGIWQAMGRWRERK